MLRKEWHDRVMAQIRFRPDHGAIRRELLAHLDDRRDALKAAGWSEADANERAVAAMGDPEEVGRQLNAVHKPLLGWVWKISGWLAVAAVAVVLFAVLFDRPTFSWYDWEKEGNLARFLQRDASTYYHVLEANPADAVTVGSRLFYDDTAQTSAKLRNRTFRMEKVALWQMESDVEGYSHNEYRSLYGVLTVEGFWPVEPAPELKHLYAVDSCGNRYWNWAARAGGGANRVQYEMYLNRTSRGLTEWHYALELRQIPGDAQWVELRCDVDGNDFVLRIDLTGGEAP